MFQFFFFLHYLLKAHEHNVNWYFILGGSFWQSGFETDFERNKTCIEMGGKECSTDTETGTHFITTRGSFVVLPLSGILNHAELSGICDMDYSSWQNSNIEKTGNSKLYFNNLCRVQVWNVRRAKKNIVFLSNNNVKNY